MRILRLLASAIPLLALAAVLDSALLAATGERLLDLYLLVTVWYAMDGRKSDALIVGAIAGLLQDALGSVVLGMHLLSKVVIGFVAIRLSSKLLPGRVGTHAVLPAGSVILEVAVFAALGLLLGQHVAERTWTEAALAVAANGLAGVVVFGLVHRLRRRRARTGMHAFRGR